MAAEPGAGISVVVPAYNAGPYLERTLNSLLRQTLDRARYEVIFVDDGSTDGTGELLDRAAHEHPELIRVEHISNSGWPGRPRNIGTELAAFPYVFYCDADDWLPDRALETLLHRVVTDDSDLVVSRAIGNRRAVPVAIFEHGDYCTTWRETPAVFTNLTTQKLFRRQFLRDRNLRFDEGRVRLEDFIFMMSAYLQSERISILGSTPCYVLELRDDAGNLTSTPAEEDDYLHGVDRIIDVVLANTHTRAEHDIAFNRVLRGELARSVTSKKYLDADEPAREVTFEKVRRLVERVPASVDLRLDRRNQQICAAIRAGDRAAIERRARWDAGVTATVRVDAVSLDPGRIGLDLYCEFRQGGDPVLVGRDGDVPMLLRTTDRDVAGRDDRLDLSGEYGRQSVHVGLRRFEDSQEWRVRATTKPETSPSVPAEETLAWPTRAEIDYTRIVGGDALPDGKWYVQVNVSSCGFVKNVRIGRARRRGLELPSAMVEGDRIVAASWTGAKDLCVETARWTLPRAAAAMTAGAGRLEVGPSAVFLPLGIRNVGGSRPLALVLSPVAPATGRPVVITPTWTADRLEFALPPSPDRARWAVGVRWADTAEPVVATGLHLTRSRRADGTAEVRLAKPKKAAAPPPAKPIGIRIIRKVRRRVVRVLIRYRPTERLVRRVRSRRGKVK